MHPKQGEAAQSEMACAREMMVSRAWSQMMMESDDDGVACVESEQGRVSTCCCS